MAEIAQKVGCWLILAVFYCVTDLFIDILSEIFEIWLFEHDEKFSRAEMM